MGDDMTNNNADSWKDKVSEMSVSGKVVRYTRDMRFVTTCTLNSLMWGNVFPTLWGKFYGTYVHSHKI